jgi:hypothetical protein
MHSRRLVILLYSPPFLPGGSGTSPAMVGLIHSDGLDEKRKELDY